jgi:hypothetical protein
LTKDICEVVKDEIQNASIGIVVVHAVQIPVAEMLAAVAYAKRVIATA